MCVCVIMNVAVVAFEAVGVGAVDHDDQDYIDFIVSKGFAEVSDYHCALSQKRESTLYVHLALPQ